MMILVLQSSGAFVINTKMFKGKKCVYLVSFHEYVNQLLLTLLLVFRLKDTSRFVF
jgi:hypothetical protein